jgi:hypothetical protein
MLVTVGPSHLLEDGVPYAFRQALDSIDAPFEGALRLVLGLGERQGCVLGLPAGVDFIVAAPPAEGLLAGRHSRLRTRPSSC